MNRLTLKAIVLATILASAVLVAIPAAFSDEPAAALSCVSDNDNGIWCDGEDDKDGLDDSSCCPIPGFQLDENDKPDYSNVVGTVYYRGVLWKKPAGAATSGGSSGGSSGSSGGGGSTPAKAPVAPTTFDAPTVVPGDDKIKVTWAAPAGASAIELYTVTISGAVEQILDVNTLSYTFEDLGPGEYIIWVSATDDSGESFLSGAAEKVVLDGTSAETAAVDLDVVPTASTDESTGLNIGAVTLGGLALAAVIAIVAQQLVKRRRRGLAEAGPTTP